MKKEGYEKKRIPNKSAERDFYSPKSAFVRTCSVQRPVLMNIGVVKRVSKGRMDESVIESERCVCVFFAF